MVAHDPVVNPSIHYLGVEGSTTINGDHSLCEAQWERIKSERSDEYGPLGAYNFGGCNSHGIRMVGRGWDMDSAANGGENGIWYNAGSRALCVLVGTDDEITPVCEAMVRAFANEAVNVHGMQWPLRGHSEFVATSCPGDHLRVTVDNVNTHHDGPPAPPPAKDDDPMLYVFNPHASSEIWCFAGNTRRHVTPDEWGFVEYTGGKAVKVSAAWFDSYPVAA